MKKKEPGGFFRTTNKRKKLLQIIFITMLFLTSISLLINNQDPSKIRNNVRYKRSMDYVNVDSLRFDFIESKIEGIKIERIRAIELQRSNFRSSGSAKQFENKIIELCGIYGCDASQVIRIMYCESTANPAATNGIYIGLFQHGIPFWYQRTVKYGIPGADIYDPYAQIHVTTRMFAEGLTYLWECK